MTLSTYLEEVKDRLENAAFFNEDLEKLRDAHVPKLLAIVEVQRKALEEIRKMGRTLHAVVAREAISECERLVEKQ